MELHSAILVILLIAEYVVGDEKIVIPSFNKLKSFYPGHKHYGGHFSHRKIKEMIGITEPRLLHDTSALRLSYSLNKVGGDHSLGTKMIQLSTAGKDSVSGRSGLQYIYNPIAFGPYFADKYGYPNVSILHQTDPIATKKRFYGKQGILEIITYTKNGNRPRGHIVLWDCDHIHEEKDWISKHHLITVEFWQSPDSSCTEGKRKQKVLDTDMKPVPFGVSRVDTVRYLNAKMQQQKLQTIHKNGKIYKTITYGNDILQ